MASAQPDWQLVRSLKQRGYAVVAGVDEVGRGCLAGPVAAAAVILDPHAQLPGVRDSKLLTPNRREQLGRLIKRQSLAIGLGWASAAEVDGHGLSWAVTAAAQRALVDLGRAYDAVVLDGTYNYLKDYCVSETHVRADNRCLQVAAASIIAKAARDAYMRQMHRLYPAYGFATHKGYGTARHLQALTAGASPIHRLSCKPVAAA